MRPAASGIEFVLDEQELGVGEFKLGGEFPGREEPPGQRVQDQPGLGAGEEHHHVVGAVPGQGRDPVPRDIAGNPQSGGEAARPALFQFAVAQGAAAVIDGDPVRGGEAAVRGPAAKRVQSIRGAGTGCAVHADSSRISRDVSVLSFASTQAPPVAPLRQPLRGARQAAGQEEHHEDEKGAQDE